MYSRRLCRLAVAGATLATGIGFSTPASASVTYDPSTMTGFVDRGDVRNAFGWTDVMLAERASGLVFQHNSWAEDTYSVSCGADAFPVVHHKLFANYEVVDAVEHAGERGAAAGYGGKLTGFRLTGPHLGVSGTTQQPTPGQPCPEDQGRAPGSTIDRADLVSSAAGWSLTVNSGDVGRDLLVNRTVTPP